MRNIFVHRTIQRTFAKNDLVKHSSFADLIHRDFAPVRAVVLTRAVSMMGNGVLRVTVMQKIVTVSKGTRIPQWSHFGLFPACIVRWAGSEDGNINLAAPQIDGDQLVMLVYVLMPGRD